MVSYKIFRKYLNNLIEIFFLLELIRTLSLSLISMGMV